MILYWHSICSARLARSTQWNCFGTVLGESSAQSKYSARQIPTEIKNQALHSTSNFDAFCVQPPCVHMVHGRAWSVIGAHNTSSQQKTRSDDLVAETFLGTVATPGSLPTDSAAAELGIVSLASRESVVVACVIWVHLLTDSFKFRKRLIERWQLRKRTHP